MKVEQYKEQVRNALRSAGKYSESQEILIGNIASSLRIRDLANADIDSLSCTTIETPQGRKAHPAFAILKDAENNVTKQLKVLGLAAEDITPDADADPLVDLTAKVISAGQKRRKKK